MTEQEIDRFISQIDEHGTEIILKGEKHKIYHFPDMGLHKPYTLTAYGQTNLSEIELRQLLAGDLTLNDFYWY